MNKELFEQYVAMVDSLEDIKDMINDCYQSDIWDKASDSVLPMMEGNEAEIQYPDNDEEVKFGIEKIKYQFYRLEEDFERIKNVLESKTF